MSSKYEQTLDEIRVLVKSNEILESDNKELSDELVNLTNENEKLKYEISELKNKIDILNRAYIDKAEECDRQSKKNENLSNIIRELQNNIFELNKKNIKLNDEHNTIIEMQKVIDELNKENIELRDESKKDKTLIRCSGYDVDKLQREIKDLKTELDMYKQLSAFGSHYKIKTGSMNPGEVNMTLELNDQFSVTVTERRDIIHES